MAKYLNKLAEKITEARDAGNSPTAAAGSSRGAGSGSFQNHSRQQVCNVAC